MEHSGAKAEKGAAKFFFWLCEWTWGLSVNLAGGLLYLLIYPKCRHERFHNAFITLVPWNII